MIAGRYKKEQIIGRGGMSEVYEVLDLSTGKRLALKMMRFVEQEKSQKSPAKQFEVE